MSGSPAKQPRFERLRAIHRRMPFETFQQLPHQLGWKHEYYGGKAYITPGPTLVTFVLPLEPPPAQSDKGIRPLLEKDLPALHSPFIDAFRLAPEYADFSLDEFHQRAAQYLHGFFGTVPANGRPSPWWSRSRDASLGRPWSSSARVGRCWTVSSSVLVRRGKGWERPWSTGSWRDCSSAGNSTGQLRHAGQRRQHGLAPSLWVPGNPRPVCLLTPSPFFLPGTGTAPSPGRPVFGRSGGPGGNGRSLRERGGAAPGTGVTSKGLRVRSLGRLDGLGRPSYRIYFLAGLLTEYAPAALGTAVEGFTEGVIGQKKAGHQENQGRGKPEQGESHISVPSIDESTGPPKEARDASEHDQTKADMAQKGPLTKFDRMLLGLTVRTLIRHGVTSVLLSERVHRRKALRELGAAV